MDIREYIRTIQKIDKSESDSIIYSLYSAILRKFKAIPIPIYNFSTVRNSFINGQNVAASADTEVRQHGFCEWINELDALSGIQPHSNPGITFGYAKGQIR